MGVACATAADKITDDARTVDWSRCLIRDSMELGRYERAVERE
jgi:hypothetical protein